MLSKISWGQFGLAAAILLLLYYLFIGATVYRKKILEILRRRPSPPLATNSSPATGEVPGQQVDMPTDLVLIERILKELRSEVLPKAGAHATKDKLLILFKNYLSGFSEQNLPSPFKAAVNQLIAKEAAQQCDIYIDPAEIAALW